MTQTQSKDVRVRIPVNYHLRLHEIKILEGKGMGEALAEALDLYFSKAEHDDLAPYLAKAE